MASTSPILASTASRAVEVAVDVGQHRDAHVNESSSAPFTTAGARRTPGSRGIRRRDAPARGGDDQAMPVEAGDVDRDGPPSNRRRARRSPVPRRPARPSRSPRFQATRQPPGASSGNASSTRSARPATARAVTAGQRPRWRGVGRPAPRPGPRRPRPYRSSPVAATATDRKAAFLAIGSSRSARLGRQDRGERQPRVAAARPEVERTASTPRSRRTRDGAQAVDDVGHVATAAGSRIAVRLIAARPGQQQPGVAVDGGPGGRRQGQSRASPGRRSRAASYAGGRSGVSSTRVGSGSRSRSMTRLLWFACHPSARRRSRRRHRLAPQARLRSSAVRPVHGRVSPGPSRTALPSRLPQCGCRTVEVRAVRASTGLSTKRCPETRLVDNPAREPPVRLGQRAPCPADRPAERPPDDVDDLVDVLVRLALLGGRPDAAARRGPRGP